MSTRELKLSRRWSILADPEGVGLDAQWYKDAPKDGWRSIRADQAWQYVLGEGEHGVAWYRRRARLPKKWLGSDTRIWLRFEAVATDCTVWVNGIEVGRHIGDYLPFQFEITKAMAGEERCEIVCRVDEIEGHEPKEWGKDPWGGHIGKGFHDVLSLQHGGIWNGVSVHRTGPIAIKPNGLRVETDSKELSATAHIELEEHDVEGRITLRTCGPDGEALPGIVIDVERGQTVCAQACAFGMERGKGAGTAEFWSPSEPRLYAMNATAVIREGGKAVRWTSDQAATRFAFRSIEAGGRDGRELLLNGKPLVIRGVLHWGHEPAHIAPSPTPDQVQAEFEALREQGFNCVCMCMWYAPKWFYDIADETGMLVWQEHPIWKSDMSDEYLLEYERLFEGFFRRDAQHPSIVIVSATCEHEKFHPELAAWWWERANELLPDKMVQLQTAFLSWTDNGKTDLYDEHTYENTGRWLPYLDDLKAELEALPPKPFVMGETIITNNWPDIAAIDAMLVERGHEAGAEYPWWVTRGLDGCRAFEANVAERFGEEALVRFREQAAAFSLEHRKRQVEALRASGVCSGWVMNHIRDVPKCRCGFMDDMDRWRLKPEQTLPWLGEVTFSLDTPSHSRSFEGGCEIEIEVSISGAGAGVAITDIELMVDGTSLVTERGEHDASVATTIELPTAEEPTRVGVCASHAGVEPNAWSMWALPARDQGLGGVCRFADEPFTDEEREMVFEEKKYSSGWGLGNASWRPVLPDTEALLPEASPVTADQLASCTGVLVTHRLTSAVLSFIESGGRVVVLASRAAEALDAKTADLWGQVPLVVERGPIREGESDCVIDLLHLDLMRHHQRAVATGERGIADHVEPFVRFVRTHDDGTPKVFDAVFATRIGDGLLAVSTLDHNRAAGGWLLDRLIAFASEQNPGDLPSCSRDMLVHS